MLLVSIYTTPRALRLPFILEIAEHHFVDMGSRAVWCNVNTNYINTVLYARKNAAFCYFSRSLSLLHSLHSFIPAYYEAAHSNSLFFYSRSFDIIDSVHLPEEYYYRTWLLYINYISERCFFFRVCQLSVRPIFIHPATRFEISE